MIVQHLRGFNSSLVRLGVKNETAPNSTVTMFQFQLGAIGRVYRIQVPTIYVVSIPAWCDWEDRDKQEYDVITSFNSSLVRLGVELFRSIKQVVKMFQFQLGAIGRC